MIAIINKIEGSEQREIARVELKGKTMKLKTKDERGRNIFESLRAQYSKESDSEFFQKLPDRLRSYINAEIIEDDDSEEEEDD